VKKIVKMY